METVSEKKKNTIYRGRPLLSYLLLCSITVFIAFCIIANGYDTGNIVWLTFLTGFAFFFVGWYAHYFEVSDNKITIRNHVMFWIKKEFLFTDIIELKFEVKQKPPSGIRLTTTHDVSQLFQSGVLSGSEWINLKSQLETYNVPINDEFVDSIVIFEFVLFKEIKELFSRYKK